MKLFLSSLSIQNVGAYRSLFGGIKQPHIAMIYNAGGADSATTSAPYIRANRDMFAEMGMTVDVIDLLDYTDMHDNLDDTLSKYDGLWVTGGNTYYLNWAIHQSGLQNIIRKHCERGLVYGGESAGAIVAGPNIDHFQAIDEPSEAPTVILEGMSLTEIVVIPHFDSQKYSDGIKRIDQALRETDATVVRLNDDQALVIDGQHKMLV